MTAWSEIISFPAPLRNASILGPAMVMHPPDPALRDEWQASYDLGRIDGEKALSEQLIKQRAEMHELFQGILSSLRGAVPQVVRDTETTLIALAVEVAQKLVGEMPISVPMIENAVRSALNEVEGSAQLTIRLNPMDLELLQNAESPLLTAPDGATEFRLVGTPDVSRGGCMVQTRFGTVDARRETKLELLKRSLLS